MPTPRKVHSELIPKYNVGEVDRLLPSELSAERIAKKRTAKEKLHGLMCLSISLLPRSDFGVEIGGAAQYAIEPHVNPAIKETEDALERYAHWMS